MKYSLKGIYHVAQWKVAQFMEQRWWRNYLKGKSKSEYLQWKKGYWKSLIEKCQPHIELKPGIRILDAGCGPAGVFIYLGKDYDMDAVDPLWHDYEKHHGLIDKSDYPKVDFFSIGLEEFHPNHQYDLIF